MSALAVILWVLGVVTAIGAAVKAWPAVWQFLCLPGVLDAQLGKLDKLVTIEAAVNNAHAAAQKAARIAEAAHDEWKGATQVVTREMARMADEIGRDQRRIDDHELRLRKLEDGR